MNQARRRSSHSKESKPMGSTHRNHEVDVIRMAALIGICIVNVPFMALPVEVVLLSPADWYDKAAAFFVEGFFQLKFFILFSFIFGWGVSIQARSARAKGQSFAKRYFRRMAGLAILGVAHATLVFSGDILLLYALLGVLLWPIRDLPAKSLIKIALWMLPLSMFFLMTLGGAMEMLMADDSLMMSLGAASLGGSFPEAVQARITEWPITFLFLFFLQSPLAFGAFVLGLAAAKTDFFSQDSRGFRFLRKYAPLFVLIGLPLNLFYAAIMGGYIPESYGIVPFFGFILIALGAPALSAVYLYLFIQLGRKLKMPELLIFAGRNSLSTYVMQGVFAGVVFGGYGLGYFNSLGLAVLIPLSLLIAIGAMLCVGVYAKIFGRGPLEPVLRWISG